MSGFAHSFARSRLQQLPADLILPEDVEKEDGEVELEEDDGGSSSASSMSSTGTIIPTFSRRPATLFPTSSWTDFFTQELYLQRQRDDGWSAKFHVYVTPPQTATSPLFVLHHGAGSSAMTFALLAQHLRSSAPEVGILAVDAREHGSTIWDTDGHKVTDLSLDQLAEDLIDMIHLTRDHLHWSCLPPIILVGHSLGGAVVTFAANSGRLGLSVLGYAVLDVVEGSALDTIKQMSTYLNTRPRSFESVQQAIAWHLRSRLLRNPVSARVSVPHLLLAGKDDQWVWRTNLEETEPFWQNWFQGMSKYFLESRGAKLLLLAGTDRLDKELMIGQMQGKFQLQVFAAAGHFLHEDLPDLTAQALVEFLRRNDRAAMKLPPKVSDLLAMGLKV